MNFQKILPHLFAFALCLLVTVITFREIVFNGKTLPQGDVQQAKAMQTEQNRYYETTGSRPSWTNQMFVGMPTYQIYGAQQSDYLGKLSHGVYFMGNTTNVTDPHVLFFWIMMLGYAGLVMFNMPWMLALVVAMSLGLMTNNLILLEAGHCNKVFAFSFALPVLGAAYRVLKGDFLIGGILFAVFTALEVSASHVQIVYYTFFVIAFMAIAELFNALKTTGINGFGKSIGILAIGTVLGILSNTTSLWTTYEYANETIRGRSQLASADADNNQNGLEKDYIFGWSYGKQETFTLIIPHYYGGSSGESWLENRNTATAKAFLTVTRQLPPEQGQQIAQFAGKYWGAQPFTSGPVYWGAVICFLAIFGLFNAKGRLKWGLLGATAFLIVLAWGKNFPTFNGLMVDYFPLYNKFRAVTMTLTVGQALVAILAALGLKSLFVPKDTLGEFAETYQKNLFAAAATTLGICVLGIFLLFTDGTATNNPELSNILDNLRGNPDPQAAGMLNIIQTLEDAMQEDRFGLAMQDTLKSIGFILAAAGAIWLYLRGTLSLVLLATAIGILAWLDFGIVNAGYINEKTFVSKKQNFAKPAPTNADKQILADKDLHYRVLDFSRGNPMSSARAAHFHKSVGGYHAAKPILFQEVAEKYGFPTEMVKKYPHILNMFNTKYLIQSADVAIPVLEAYGNAWFVNEVKTVPNANAELDSLANLAPRQTAIIQESFADYIKGLNFANAAGANDKIYLTSYHPEKMVYKSSTQNERFAVFSEIYYPPTKGWSVWIDGQQAPDFIKTDYLLRGIRIPAGEHTIEMRFAPQSVILGETITLISSLLLLAGVGFLGWLGFKKMKASESETDSKHKYYV
jgi:hypothetical protein